jgi:hypothetical protein
MEKSSTCQDDDERRIVELFANQRRDLSGPQTGILEILGESFEQSGEQARCNLR